jgi:hypothetical protein
MATAISILTSRQPGWGKGGWRSRKLHDDSPFGRAKSIVGYASRHLDEPKRFPRPDGETVNRYCRLFQTWAAAGTLDDTSFRDRYLGSYTSLHKTSWLRSVAKMFADRDNYGDMEQAAKRC